jgi:mannose-6-phosphate isomerase-like protein (cupin superfamily)
MTSVRRFGLTVAAVTLAGFAAVNCPSASATPSTGVEAKTIAQSTVDGKDYVTRELTIAPGGSTGWHYHDGEVFGVVRHGTLTHDKADCTIDGVYGPDAGITEASGAGYVHIGRNLGPDPVVMWVVYIQPAGAPLFVDAPDPGCGFA